jgi:nucleoside-diphosphate-sugar epimerase
MLSIAILGATGQIGRGLAQALPRENQLHLFARTPAPVHRHGDRDHLKPLDSFGQHPYDIVINAAGPGSRRQQLSLGNPPWADAEALDLRIMKYLEHSTGTAYVHLSTGAVYGFNRDWPIPVGSHFRASAMDADRLDAYPLSKIAAEARHRAHRDLKIYDIRIFGYFSRYIGLDDGFFLSEVASALVQGTPLRTSSDDMVRDYIDQAELSAMISTLVCAKAPNGTFDIYSKAPVGKRELLEHLAREFGLRVDYRASPVEPLAKLPKPVAPSACRNAAAFGHVPRRSSKDIVTGEMRELLASHGSAAVPRTE